MRYMHFILGVGVVVGLVLAFSELPTRAADKADPAKVVFTCDNGKLTLNGAELVLPCELKTITTAMGEPDRTPKGGADGKKPVPIWDKLGIVCHLSDDGKMVKEISFTLGENPYFAGGEFAAKGTYTGGLTVDGVKFEGVVTFKEFWEKRSPNGEKLRGGEIVNYENGNTLSLSCKEPAKGPIWKVAFFVRTK